jgi:hypothetical protein
MFHPLTIMVMDEVVLPDPETPVAPVKLDSLKILKKYNLNRLR